MPVTVSELRTGLQMVDAVLPMREVLSQTGSSVVQTVISNKAAEEYLFFAKALDSLRSYAAGPKLIPGTDLYNFAKPLIDAMEELDGLIAQERAGVPENVDNPYIISDDLRGGLASFAYGLSNAINRKKDDFTLENEDIELLKALDGMVRHLDQSDQVEWRTLKRAIPAMGDPVAMDDGIFDSIQSRWTFKADIHKAEEEIKKQRKEALSNVENGLAMQLANSRAAAKADVEIKKADPSAELSAAGMLYRNFFSTYNSLRKYREKYLDQMGEQDSEALKNCISWFLKVEDELAGPDTHLEDVSPNLVEAQELIELDLWPSVVNYFGRFKPDSRVTGDDAVLFRRLYELQEALGLPEKIGECDMRQVYNHVKDLEKRAAPDESVMDDAAQYWSFAKQKRFDETEAGRKKLEEEQERIRKDNELKQKEAERLAELKKKADEDAAALKKKQLEDEKRRKEIKEKEDADERLRQEKLQEEESLKQQEEARQEFLKDLPGYKDAQEDKEFEALKKEMDAERVEKGIVHESVPEPVKEDPLPIPSPDDKTWGEYAKELEAYLKQQRDLIPRSGSNIQKPRIEAYPHITQIVHALVAINRYGSEELKNETVNTRELTTAGKQLLVDEVFKKVLEDPQHNKWLQSKDYKIFWNHLVDASRKQYETISQQQRQRISSPYDISVVEMRNWLKKSEMDKEKPFRRNIGNIVERLDNVRYNADIQKTGFLFFKPSDTGLFQTAVEKLKAIAQADAGQTVSNSAKNEAYLAVKAYLDDRKGVRSHEYGKRRWEKMMCAYAALETPEKFAAYCKELNEYRKIDNPMDPDYVSPEAFGPGRMDLANPQIPLREARAQVLKEYKEPVPADAGTADKDLWYFARVAVMRNTATKQNDWGALVDMKQVDEQARQLVKETKFVDLVQSEKFKNGDTAERQALYETAALALAPKNKDWGEEVAEQAKIVKKESDKQKEKNL